ncbi:toxin-antitoxin system YwqK family antitoxin [Polaribacter sargassicola]|uniref:toxin-antitoxin system YwqK family antitoxin n=1 Tax=Polaribacter sargassicola TaxID=2836891 RepID=UPI001F229DD8|nr:hypothetical protein [Polaribacter sp. DS7-9]MCG1035473.1 hypothetical protein [Polaribacter sp. DS7-9]
MKVSKIILLLIFIVGCKTANKEKTVSINKIIEIDQNNIVHKDSLILNGNQGNWYYKNKLYNGFAVKYYSNGILKEKTGFYNGKKQGAYKVWFNNGVLKLESHYHQNTLEGSYKTWWVNGVLSSTVKFVKGKKEGEEKQWYSDGSLSKQRNLVNGKENGIQKGWLKNGKIYINYEAKNGRTFGMKRANLCYQLKNEEVEESKKI